MIRWNRSRTSEHDNWNKLFLSNFLKTALLSSTNYQTTNYISCLKNNSVGLVTIQEYITLFDIMMVSNALLLELIATFKVVAWSKTKQVCITEYKLRK